MSGWFPHTRRLLPHAAPTLLLIPPIKVKPVNTAHQLVFNEIRGWNFGAITVLPSTEELGVGLMDAFPRSVWPGAARSCIHAGALSGATIEARQRCERVSNVVRAPNPAVYLVFYR